MNIQAKILYVYNEIWNKGTALCAKSNLLNWEISDSGMTYHQGYAKFVRKNQKIKLEIVQITIVFNNFFVVLFFL